MVKVKAIEVTEEEITSRDGRRQFAISFLQDLAADASVDDYIDLSVACKQAVSILKRDGIMHKRETPEGSSAASWQPDHDEK